MGEAAIYEFSSRQQQTICASCGVCFCMPASMLDLRRKDGASFYCPNGHVLTFKDAIKRENDLLKSQLDATKRSLEWQRERGERLRKEAEHQEHRARAARGQVTKIKNRVGNGVCPCCNRTFQNLLRHMKTKHPRFAHDAEHEKEVTP